MSVWAEAGAAGGGHLASGLDIQKIKLGDELLMSAPSPAPRIASPRRRAARLDYLILS
jgi:hypothetical protein